MTLELVDARCGQRGYPRVTKYDGCDQPDKNKIAWRKRIGNDYINNPHYIAQTELDITYTLNSRGYRCPEFSEIPWNDCYVFLGCSHTYGTGVDDNDTLPAVIEQMTGIQCINLGIPGGCNHFSAINSAALINDGFVPRGIFFQHTFESRWFTMEGEDGNNVKTHTVSNKNDSALYKQWLISERTYKHSNKMTIDTVRALWKDRTTLQEYWINGSSILLDNQNDSWNSKWLSRDGQHFNAAHHDLIAEDLLKIIE